MSAPDWAYTLFGTSTTMGKHLSNKLHKNENKKRFVASTRISIKGTGEKNVDHKMLLKTYHWLLVSVYFNHKQDLNCSKQNF
jgi:hypothetical protein